VVAARLAEAGVDVLVLEAGPDPGPYGSPRWPADLLDAARLGTSLDWGFDSGDTYPGQLVRFERARVIGGCSAHNGAVQTWGHRADYDGWAALGNPGWATDDLVPHLARASERLRVSTYSASDLTPWQRAWYEAGPAAGLPHLGDLNDLDEAAGIAPESVNIVDGVRWNAAFAYLDPVRELPNLRIVAETLVDRLVLDGTRVAGVAVRQRGREHRIAAQLVVLASGTFGTPAVLLRSGVGPPDELRALGIGVAADLPGVGANLHDQPFAMVRWEGSEEMAAAMRAADAAGWAPDEQVMAKAASSHEHEAFDLHLLPYSPAPPGEGRGFHAGAGALCPRSRGRVTLVSRDPGVLPRIDHGFLTDPEGHDVAVLAEGVARLRELAAQPELRRLAGAELVPGPQARSAAELAAYFRAHLDCYWHPVGTARMGPESERAAVAGARGAVHGLTGCVLADCSLMPFVPRATTALPALVIGERVAECILEDRHTWIQLQ
jgi:choline dehydrogenase